MLSLTVSMEMAAKANAMQWLGHALGVEGNPPRMALNFEVREKGKKGHPQSTWKEKIKDNLLKASSSFLHLLFLKDTGEAAPDYATTSIDPPTQTAFSLDKSPKWFQPRSLI